MRILILLAMLVIVGPNLSHAFLIGDTIQLGHYFEDSIAPFGENPGSRVVAAGGSDAWTYATGLYTVNPEDTGFFTDFFYTGTWSLDQSFNGLRLSGIDAPITAVDIDTNFAGWDNARFTQSGNDLNFNWSGLSWKEETYFNARVRGSDAPDPIHAVPEPVSLFLLGAGLSARLAARMFGATQCNRNS